MMRYKILFYFLLILEIGNSTMVLGGENEPEAWPASASCSHIVSDITTLGSIITGGLAAVDAIRGTPDAEFGMSVATIALIGVATVARGCADYFDTKTTAACCRDLAECGVVLEECGNCCGNLWCCNLHSQAKYKQWSELWKIPGYIFYGGSLACNAASLYYTHGYEPAPVLDILAVLSSTAAIFSNKNTFRYISKYYRERIARTHMIKLLGKRLPLPLANFERSVIGINSPLGGRGDIIPTREEYSQNTGLYHYLLWEQPIREVREYFRKSRIEVPEDVINSEDFLNTAPTNPTIDHTKIPPNIINILCVLANNNPQDWNGLTAQQMDAQLPQNLGGRAPNVLPVLVQLTGISTANLSNTSTVNIVNRLLQSLANKEVNDLNQSRMPLNAIHHNAQDKPFADQLITLINLHVSFLGAIWEQIDLVRQNLGDPIWFQFHRVNNPYEAKLFIAQTKREILSNRRGRTADNEVNLIDETHNPLI